MRRRSIFAFTWLLAAPFVSADATWVANGPSGGDVQMIVASPSWLYAATRDGVFRSNDQGSNWQRAGTQIPRDAAILSLAVNRHNTSLVLAGGAGFIYRSTDAGANWTPVAVPRSPTRIVFSSRSNLTNEVFYLSPSNVWSEAEPLQRSNDGGLTWQTVNGPNATPLRAKGFAADDFANRYYALDGGQQLLTSMDGGASWQVSGPIFAPSNNARQPLLVDPHNNDVVIWSADNLDASYLQRHRVSAGTTSYLMTAYTANELAGDWLTSGRLWFSAINEFVQPAQRLYESLDHGLTWNDVNSDRPVRMLSTDRGVSGRLYGATAAGPEVSEDAGRHWETRSQGIGLAPANALGIDPRNPAIVLAATAGNGVWRSIDSGLHWQRGDGMDHRAVLSLARSARDADIVYAGTDTGVFKSGDGGLSWAALPATAFPGANDTRLTRFYVNRNDSDHLVAINSGWGSVGWSDDGGRSWRAASGLSSTTRRIAASPNGSERVYALGYPHVSLQLRRADSHGAAFVPVGPAIVIHAFGVHPYNDARLVAIQPGPLGSAAYLSNDAGETWQQRGAVPLTIASVESHIRFDPCDPEVLYAATGNWVYRSDDLGLTWHQEATPLKLANRQTDIDARCTGGLLAVAVASLESSVQIRTSSPNDRILRGSFDG